MLYDLIKNDYGKEEELNCAEKIIHGANQAYDLGLSPESLKVAKGFGGGMGIGSTCGALTGGIMAISKKFAGSNLGKEEFYAIIQDYLNEYEARMGSIYCKELKEKYVIDDDSNCDQIIEESAKLLDEIINKYNR